MKDRKLLSVCLMLLGGLATSGLSAQHAFYPTAFRPDEVTLLDGPFKRAQQRNFESLMEYDTDRLLTPFVRQSGLSSTKDEKSPYYQWEYHHPPFTSFAWNPALAMDGHLLGHYLSALSLAYAASHDDAQRAAFRQRIDYIVGTLCDCQAVFDNDKSGMRGFIGGLPDNSIWTSLLKADYQVYNQRGNWVPYYCEHKVMAGLRDAWVYAGNEQAREALRKMCDWVIQTVALFNQDLMELHMLQWETGGMHEVLAEASQIFGDSKYLKAAHKFSHEIVVENMNSDADHTFIDKRHTNELAAMFLGFARISQMKSELRYDNSARAFWEEVTTRRLTAIGGTGVGGFFTTRGKASSVLTDGDGPDLCTSVNMMRLSAALFARSRKARYMDYCERVMLNHVLASQDPETGGFTYYTSLRPESYRIYSKTNAAMWCCLGSGMESQSMYGEFIYTMADDTLFVNQFVASELNSDKVQLTQQSDYPYGTTSRITIRRKGNYQLAVRHPDWTTADFRISVNGTPLKARPETCTAGQSAYICCGHNWKEGDVVEVTYPMTLTFEPCPGNGNYIALRYGPCLLAAQTTTTVAGQPHYELLQKEYGGEGLHDFSPQARLVFPNSALAPMLICPLPDVPKRIRLADASRLEFEVDASAPGSMWQKVSMRPFFDLHHCRYTIYWNQQSEEAWRRNPLYEVALKHQQDEESVLDEILPGNAESETTHPLLTSETGSRGMLNGCTFREAPANHWFEYKVDVTAASDLLAQGKALSLVCMFCVNDRGRSCDILIDGESIERYTALEIENPGKNKFFEQTFRIPDALLQGKKQVTLRFSSTDSNPVPRLFRVRLCKCE